MYFAPPDVTPVRTPLFQLSKIRPGWIESQSVRSSTPRATSTSSGQPDFGEVFTVDITDIAVAPTPGKSFLQNQPILDSHLGSKSDPGGAGTISALATERIALMMARHAATNRRTEILARLEMLNERLLLLMPRVTPEKVATLESLATKIGDIRKARMERASDSQRK